MIYSSRPKHQPHTKRTQPTPSRWQKIFHHLMLLSRLNHLSSKSSCATQGHRLRLVCLTDPPYSASVGALPVTSKLPRVLWTPWKYSERSDVAAETDSMGTEPAAGPTGEGHPNVRVVCEVCGKTAREIGWAVETGRGAEQVKKRRVNQGKGWLIPLPSRSTNVKSRGAAGATALVGKQKREAVAMLIPKMGTTTMVKRVRAYP